MVFFLWSKVFLEKGIANRTIGKSFRVDFPKSKPSLYYQKKEGEAISEVTAVAAIALGVYLYNRYVAHANAQPSQDDASGHAVPTEAAMPVGIEMNAVGIQMKDDSQETPKSPKSPKTLKKKKAKKPT